MRSRPLLRRAPVERLRLRRDRWKDNRVDYFYSHGTELAAAHVAGVMYGAGAGGMTTPESDGSNLINKQKAYVTSGGQALCQ